MTFAEAMRERDKALQASRHMSVGSAGFEYQMRRADRFEAVMNSLEMPVSHGEQMNDHLSSGYAGADGCSPDF